MRNIRIAHNQDINLEALPDTTPAQAIYEAIAFKSLNNCGQVDLSINGFTIGIELDSDIHSLAKEYHEWKKG